MQVLTNKIDPETFFKKVSELPQRILLLDYDGTLAPFQEDPQTAYPYKGVEEILNSIISSDSVRVVLISGRRADDLTKLLRLDNMPEIRGSHGFERLLPDGRSEQKELGDKECQGLDQAKQWAEETDLQARLERKPAGLAFHWRGINDEMAESIRSKIVNEWQNKAADFNLELLDFECGIELKSRDTNKGRAVKSIFDELDQPAAVAYLGDDLTDEDAFEALGNKGLAVLVRKELCETSADLWIKPPLELIDFLTRFDSACHKNTT